MAGRFQVLNDIGTRVLECHTFELAKKEADRLAAASLENYGIKTPYNVVEMVDRYTTSTLEEVLKGHE